LAAAIGIVSGGGRIMAQQAASNKQAAKQAATKDPAANVPPLSQIGRGREMFARVWKKGDAKTPNGDGLGPMFKARSCAECHSQGGMGGGGDVKHNVDLLSVILPADKSKIDRTEFADYIGIIHPAFTAGRPSTVLPSITLHKSSTNPAYAKWRAKIVGLADSLAVNDPGASDAKSMLFEITQRSAPALFGAGLIDSIPDKALRHVAEIQAKRHSGVKGQVPPATDGGVGKFGWRGQTATLKQFVMGACANELGLTVPGSNQAIDPLDPTHKSPGLDLTQSRCDDLVAYVASLPRPVQRTPVDQKEAAKCGVGETVFAKVGCAECHVAKIGDVAGIYSDLLLHDMGTRLYDPAGANPTVTSGGSSGACYYGGSNDVLVDVPPATKRQWRTPPLWGVADSGPYLHDGRAPTLQDAILEHGGEADGAREAYLGLPTAARANLLAFLGSLRAHR